MNELETQQIAGKFFDLEINPETAALAISLNQPLVLYKKKIQITGDEKLVSMSEDGSWQTELVDTDNMPAGTHYIFKINDRIYKKLVPVSPQCHNFNDLPDMIF